MPQIEPWKINQSPGHYLADLKNIKDSVLSYPYDSYNYISAVSVISDDNDGKRVSSSALSLGSLSEKLGDWVIPYQVAGVKSDIYQ